MTFHEVIRITAFVCQLFASHGDNFNTLFHIVVLWGIENTICTRVKWYQKLGKLPRVAPLIERHKCLWFLTMNFPLLREATHQNEPQWKPRHVNATSTQFEQELNRANKASRTPSILTMCYGDNQSRQIKPYRIIAINVRRVTGHTLQNIAKCSSYFYIGPRAGTVLQ